MAADPKPKLNSSGLQTYLGAVAASGIADGLPVFWAIGYLVKEANSPKVQVSLDQLAAMTGYNRKQLTSAIKSIRVSGHQVDWTSKEECTVTINQEIGVELMGPFMINQKKTEEEPSVDLLPPITRLNELMGTKYQLTPKTAGQLRSRITNDKMTIDELVYVVEVKCEQWKGDEKMEAYLRPSTLFGTKAIEYAQERKRNKITEEKVVSREDLSRMWAG